MEGASLGPGSRAEPSLRSDGTTPIPENELVYPLPKVSLTLEVRTANQEKEKAVGTHDCQIAKPQNLFFYTSTMPDEGEDTDKWRPVKNVDYVNLPKARPCTDFRVAAVQTTPDDPPENPGDNPVTFELVANLPAVNIVAGKGVEPMAAVLRTVTMMRAEYIPEAELVKNNARAVVDNLAGLRNALINDFQTLLEKIPADLNDAQNDLARVKAMINEEKGKLAMLQQDGIRKYLDPVTKTFQNNFQQVKDKADNAGKQAFSKAVRTLTADGVKKGILVEINKGYNEIINKPVADLEAARNRLESYMRLLHEGLIVTEVSPAVFFKPLNETLELYKSMVQSVRSDINKRVQELNANIHEAKKIVQGDLNELTAFLTSIQKLAAIGLAANMPLVNCVALRAIFASRSIASILYVRERLRLEKGKRYSRMIPTIAHIAALFLTAALAYYGLSPFLTILAMSVLAYRAISGLSAGRSRMKAMQIGVWEVIYGTIVVLSVVIGHYGGF